MCGKSYDWNVKKGNFVGERRVCPACLPWHKWCNGCRSAPLRSEFSRQSKRPDGLQNACIRCNRRGRGGHRVRQCGGCHAEFVVETTRYYGTRTLWLCEDCNGVSKHCRRCDTVKPREEFNAARDKVGGLVAHCRACKSATWNAKPAAERRKQKLRSKYDLTHEQFEEMLDSQGGGCAICGSTESGRTARGNPKPLSVDHDHITGKVRAILCSQCNSALGMMRDDPSRLRKAAAYLESFV